MLCMLSLRAREDIDYLVEEIKKFEVCLKEMMDIGLPLQLIHGDCE